MARRSSRVSENLSGSGWTADGSKTADATKGSINLRIDSEVRQLIDDAAAALGKSRTEFMVESARRQAIDVLLDRRLFVLDPEQYDAFVKLLNAPPEPDPKLRALMSRVPAWER